MEIQEIIAKLNYLNGNIRNMPSSVWLSEIDKYENLWSNHPDADKTRFVENSPTIRLEMKGGSK
tara:strand:+ start:70 stop:261 length:192 start_codon:yes stop_codon:yes gene_type:complete